MNTQLRRSHHARKNFLDLAPMVDVTLTLVVFLLLSSESIDIQDLPVQLPQAASGSSDIKAESVQISAEGQITWQKQAYGAAELVEAIKASGTVDRVTIYADENARHGRVTEVVDRLRNAGIEHIFYGVESVDTW